MEWFEKLLKMWFGVLKANTVLSLSLLLAIVVMILFGGFLTYTLEELKKSNFEPIFFFVTTSFTLAGLTSLGGIIGNKEEKEFKTKFLRLGIIFLLSGLLLLYFIGFAYYGALGKDTNTWWLHINASDYTLFGGILYMLGLLIFILGTFYFLFVLIEYYRKISKTNTRP